MSTSSQPDQTASGCPDRREWNAASYHRVANPHVDWGRAVLERLPLRGDDTVIDAGCGSGRLTELLLERLPEGNVIAIDQSANMLARAEQHLAPRFGSRVTYRQADLLTLTVDEPVDAIFSTATFHWIPDHPRHFATLFQALTPGGWLVAQCGGGSNIARLNERAMRLLREEPYKRHIGDWSGPWHFANAEVTADRLAHAGFVEIATEVIPAPVTMDDAAAYHEFLATVVFGTHLERLPDDLREPFVASLTAQAATDDPPFQLDYWRLNLQARRP